MEEYSTDSFANRGDPIPLIEVEGQDDQSDYDSPTSDGDEKEGKGKESKRKRLRRKISSLNPAHKSSDSGGKSMQDRLLDK